MEENERTENARRTRVWAPQTLLGAILFALFIGITGNGLWELLIKPGMSESSRAAVTLYTAGSETLRDSIYASAALDPTHQATLMLLLLALVYVPVVVLSGFIGYLLPMALPKLKHWVRRVLRLKPSANESATTRPPRFAIGVVFFLMLVLIATGRIGFALVNESVVVWRSLPRQLTDLLPVP